MELKCVFLHQKYSYFQNFSKTCSMPKRSILFLSVSIFLFIFHSYVSAADIDHSEQYESSVEFDKAYDCLQLELVVYDRMHRCAKEALEISESFENPDPKKIAMITANYGLSLLKKPVPEKEKGLKELTHASNLIEAAFGSDSCEMASVLFELAYIRSQEKKHLDSAFSDYEKSLSICVMEKNTQYAIKILAFVQSFESEKLNKEQLASAKSFSLQAHEIYQKFMGPTFMGTRAIAFELGKLYFITEEHQKSIQFFEKSYPPNIGNFRNNMGANPETLDQLFSYLSESYEKLGDIKESNKYKTLKSVARLSTNFELDPRIAKTDLMPISVKQPRYPRRANMIGREGYAVIEVTVLPSGKVRNPRVMEEAPEKFFFGAAAMRVAKQLRYAENPDRPEQKTLYKYTFYMQRNR